MKKIYMYCSLDVFDKIIDNPKFKLSDISNSNDKHELKQYNLLAEKTLKPLYKVLKETSNGDKYEYINDAIIELEDVIEKLTVLAACFSELNDSKHMWLEYGNHGDGVSIGFDVNDIDNLAKSYNISFGKVNYLNLKEIELPTFIDSAYNFNNKRDEYIEKSILTKDLGYRDEKEWRLYYKIYDTDQFLINLAKVYKINCNMDEIVPPVFINFNKALIKEIIIGSAVNEDKLNLIKAKLDLSIKILYSKIPCQKSRNR